MIAMNHLPPPAYPPSPTHGVLHPPTAPNTVPVAQPQLQGSSTPGLQPPQLQQQPHANCNTVTQAAAIPGVNAAQSAPSKPGSHTWRWFLKFLRVCAALLASGSIILFIYYQLRADQRDELNLKYTTHSHDLSVWTAHKDYCDFHLSHDNVFNADTCLVDPPPDKLRKTKRSWEGKTNTVVWNSTYPSPAKRREIIRSLQVNTGFWDFLSYKDTIVYADFAIAAITLVPSLLLLPVIFRELRSMGSNSAL